MTDAKTLPAALTDFQEQLRNPDILTGADVQSASDALGKLSEKDQKVHAQQLRQLRVGVEQASSHKAINADAHAELQKLSAMLPEPELLDVAAHHGKHVVDDAQDLINQAPEAAKKAWNTAGKDMEEIRQDFSEDLGKGAATLGQKGLEYVNTYRDLHQSHNYLVRGAAYALTGLGVYWLATKILGTSKTGFFGKIFRGIGLVALAGGVYHFVNREKEKTLPSIFATLPAENLVNHAASTLILNAAPHAVEILPNGIKIDGILYAITLGIAGKNQELDLRNVHKTADGRLSIALRTPDAKEDKQYNVSEANVRTVLESLLRPPHRYTKTLLGTGITIERKK